MSYTLEERLEEFYRRLQAASPVDSADDALKQLGRILDEVEDELSGIPKSSPPPAPDVFDGRMYPPLSDFVIHDSDGAISARTRGHIIEIAADGSITITNKRTQAVEFRK
jgi:hypothetical protein